MKVIILGELIEFPAKVLQGWDIIEKTLREIFQNEGSSIKMQDSVLAKMKGVFQRYSIQFSVTVELPENLTQDQNAAVSSAVGMAFRDYEKQLNDFMNHILLDRLLLEIELYKIRNDEKEKT